MRKLFLVTALLCLTFALPAGGQTRKDDAERKRNAGEQAYNAGQFRQALKLFKEAWEIRPLARYLFNAAKACIRLEDLEGAIYYYERYLAGASDQSDRTEVEQEMEHYRKVLSKRGLIEVKMTSVPPGATIRTTPERESEVTRTPGSFFLPPGPWTITFELEGHEPVTMEVNAVPGTEPIKVNAVLVNMRNLSVEVAPDLGGTNRGKDGEPTVTAPTGQSEFPLRTLLIATGGAGLLTVAAGGWFWFDGEDAMSDAVSQYNAGKISREEHDKQYRDGRDDYILGQWLVASGALVATSAAVCQLLFSTETETTPPSSMVPAPSLAPTSGGFVVSLTRTW